MAPALSLLNLSEMSHLLWTLLCLVAVLQELAHTFAVGLQHFAVVGLRPLTDGQPPDDVHRIFYAVPCARSPIQPEPGGA